MCCYLTVSCYKEVPKLMLKTYFGESPSYERYQSTRLKVSDIKCTHDIKIINLFSAST